jgi:CRP-like cAMP-binding protein
MPKRENVTAPCVQFADERPSDCVVCAVRASALFSELERSELDERLRPIRNGFCAAGAVIYRAGEPAEAAFSIRAGVIKLLHPGREHEMRIVRLLGRGAAIGLEAFEGERYANTAVATREVNLCRIPRSVLIALGRDSPRLYAGLVNKWKEHAARSESWISDLYAGNLDERTCSLVRMLCDVSGDPTGAVRLLKNDEMADVLGVSVESVSRCVSKLKRGGVIRRVGPWTYDCRQLLHKA